MTKMKLAVLAFLYCGKFVQNSYHTTSFEHFTLRFTHTTIFTDLNTLHEVYTHLIIDFKQNEDEGKKLRHTVN